MKAYDVFEKYGLQGFHFVIAGDGWKLKFRDLLLLSFFREATLMNGSWYGTDEELGVIIERSVRTVRRIKKRMVELGYIKLEEGKVIYSIDEPECPDGLQVPVFLEYIPSENKLEWRTMS